MNIITDSREKLMLWKNTEVKKLDVGDYSFSFDGKDYSDIIAIERKNLSDLFGTLGSGHARFKRELERSKKLDYFAIVIDGSHKQINDKDFPGAQYTKIKGYVINKILATLHIKYGINYFYAGNRTSSKRLITDIFKAYLTQKGEAC